MKKRYLKKSEVLSEGYVKGLRQAGRVIGEMVEQALAGEASDPDERLFNACRFGNVNEARLAFKAGASCDARDKFENTPLHIAIKNGHQDVIEYVIKFHASDSCLKAGDQFGDTPLHLAARYGNEAACRLLLDLGADVNADADNGETPLHAAFGHQKQSVCKWLLHKGADVTARDELGNTALHSYGGSVSIYKLLLYHGADVDAVNNAGETPLDMVARSGDAEVFEYLLSVSTEPSPDYAAFLVELTGSRKIKRMLQRYL